MGALWEQKGKVMTCDCQFSLCCRPSQRSLPGKLGPEAPPQTPDLVRQEGQTQLGPQQPNAGTVGLGPSLEPVLASREQNLTLIRYPRSLPRATMVAFVGKYCMSKFFSTEEAFVKKRGHRNIAQSLGQKVGKMAGWPALFWR